MKGGRIAVTAVDGRYDIARRAPKRRAKHQLHGVVQSIQCRVFDVFHLTKHAMMRNVDAAIF